jgi:hypothetical protein
MMTTPIPLLLLLLLRVAVLRWMASVCRSHLRVRLLLHSGLWWLSKRPSLRICQVLGNVYHLTVVTLTEKEEVGKERTHTTFYPANRCRFTILTIRFLGSLSGSVDGALTDSWNLAHNACCSLQVLLIQKDVPHLFAVAKSFLGRWKAFNARTFGVTLLRVGGVRI